MAATRDGPGNAKRGGALPGSVADPDHLADVGDSPVRCDSAREFLAQVSPSATSAAPAPAQSTRLRAQTGRYYSTTPERLIYNALYDRSRGHVSREAPGTGTGCAPPADRSVPAPPLRATRPRGRPAANR